MGCTQSPAAKAAPAARPAAAAVPPSRTPPGGPPAAPAASAAPAATRGLDGEASSGARRRPRPSAAAAAAAEAEKWDRFHKGLPAQAPAASAAPAPAPTPPTPAPAAAPAAGRPARTPATERSQSPLSEPHASTYPAAAKRRRPTPPQDRNATAKAAGPPEQLAATTAPRVRSPPRPAAGVANGRANGAPRPGGRGGKRKKSKEEDIQKDLNDQEKAIYNEILDRSPEVFFEDVAGLEKVKYALDEICIQPNLNPELFSGLATPSKGVLLFGPPGNGKTMLAKAVATECGATFFNISASSLTSKFHGESEKMVRALFSLAEKMQPAVVFIDEIDSMLTSRSSGEHDATRRLKTEFLVQMDGAGSAAGRRILLLGATNRPQELDDAVLRRLPKRVHIPLPDPVTREALVARKVKDEKHDAGLPKLVAGMTEGYSGSDLARLCEDAAIVRIRELSRDQRLKAKPEELRPITVQDFRAALRAVRPSVDSSMLQRFAEWDKKFGAH
eukprot:TRINITY_DN1967_c5_g1_i1.p1 TRINITY_DN1967_c5_g1~~TRINITY_DN1967_c5_g1_i1.p1  ORF type:complete len:502 (+),score=159.08 TRINITY_DN1967_c5_g1_i1:59-1564(+)